VTRLPDELRLSRSSSLAAGMNDFVAKPVKPEDQLLLEQYQQKSG
jgi:CheY-like chemotaxis protein